MPGIEIFGCNVFGYFISILAFVALIKLDKIINSIKSYLRMRYKHGFLHKEFIKK